MNIKFFHASTKQRRARNRILDILDHDGTWIDSEEGVEKVAKEYFPNLFNSSTSRDPSPTIRDIPRVVTPGMNEAFTRDIIYKEVKCTLFSLNHRKTLGLNGMRTLFFQRLWTIISLDLIKMVKSFFRLGLFDGKINETNIFLMPKGNKPRAMSGFRSISLCNVGYKVISNILSLRLKKFLLELISETQSAIMASKLIIDNIMIAHENFHAHRSNSASQKNFMALKTYMSKVYDRVKWSFLRALMEKMGFDSRWVSRSCSALPPCHIGFLSTVPEKGV